MTDALKRVPRTLRTSLLLIAALAPPMSGCAGEPLPETPPRLLRPVTAETFPYPEVLREEGAEGATVLRVRIDTAGRVDSVRVEKPSQHAAFDSAAVEGSRRLVFEPARRGAEAVARWYRLPVRFDLTPAPSAAGKP